jgi:DNA polymerase III gamma/tau subunit
MVLGTAANASIVALTDAWLNATGAEGLGIINEALRSGTDPRQFCHQMVDHLRTILILQATGPDLSLDIPEEYKEATLAQAQRAPRQALIKAVKRFQEAALQPLSGWQPQLPLELAFMELLPDTPTPIFPDDAQEETLPDHEEQDDAKKDAQPDKSQAPKTTPAKVSSPEDKIESGMVKDKDANYSPSKASTKRQINLEIVKAKWREMINQVGQKDKNLPPLLAMSKPLAVEGNVIILGFDFPIFKEKFDRTEHGAGIIEDSFSNLTGAQCTVRCVITSDYTVPISREDMEALAEELGGIVQEEN